MPPAQGAAPGNAPAPAEGGEQGGAGGPQEIIVDIDKRLGALAEAASNPAAKAVIEEIRDFFQAKMEELLSGGGPEPAGGPTTPEQGGAANVRPAGP
jgi:hypothetical protein